MSNANRAAKVVLIREAEEKGKKLDVGYLARHFTRCHFPMTKPPKDLLSWDRRDGDCELSVVVPGNSKFGIPYGSDLIALYGLCTKGRELYKKCRGEGREWDGVVSFSSTAEMLRYFGDPPTKQYYTRRMKSLMRLYDSQIRVFEILDRKGKAEKRLYDKADLLKSVVAWFHLEDRQIGMPFENVIRFSPEMIEWIRQAPVFEDEKVFLLRQTIGALQLYLLLRDRCAQNDLRDKSYTLIPIHGPNSLESQLGWVNVPAPEKVRWQLNDWLKVIRATVWPECPGEIWQGRDGYWRLKVWYVPPLFVR